MPEAATRAKRRRVRRVAAAVAGAVGARRVKDDVKAASRSYRKSVTVPVPIFVVAATLGLFSFVVLSVGFVVALNVLLGPPAGHFIVAGAYLLVAGVLVAVAVRRGEAHREEAREHMKEARRDVRGVIAPWRVATGRDGG